MKKIYFLASLFFLGGVQLTNAQVNLDSGLVSYLNFNDESTADMSPITKTTTVHGDVAKFGCGLDLSSCLKIDDESFALQAMVSDELYAASFWAKTDNPVSDPNYWFTGIQFYENGVSGNANGAGVSLGGATILGTDEEVTVHTTNEVSNQHRRTMAGPIGLDDEWHHYLINYVSGVYEIYVDGVQQSTFDGTSQGHVGLISLVNPVFGTRYYSDGSILNNQGGMLDEIRLYDRALLSGEISELATSYTNPLLDDLILYLDFEGDTDDKSGNNYPTQQLGTVTIGDYPENSYLAYEANSGVQATVPMMNAYATSFYFRSAERVDESESGLVPVQFREEGTSSTQDAELTFLGGGTILGVDEVISIGKTDNPSNQFPRTMVSNIDFDDQWHHVLYNWNGVQYEIFLDGEQQATNVGTSGGNTPLVEMRNPAIGARYYPDMSFGTTKGAWIDEVRIYGRSLNGIEIEKLATEIEFPIVSGEDELYVQEKAFVVPTLVSDGTQLMLLDEVRNITVVTMKGETLGSYKNVDLINVASWKDGVYQIVIEDLDGNVFTQKLMKQ